MHYPNKHIHVQTWHHDIAAKDGGTWVLQEQKT
jgi:hypothetical protein